MVNGDSLLRAALAAAPQRIGARPHRLADVGIVSKKSEPVNASMRGGDEPYVVAALNGEVDNLPIIAQRLRSRRDPHRRQRIPSYARHLANGATDGRVRTTSRRSRARSRCPCTADAPDRSIALRGAARRSTWVAARVHRRLRAVRPWSKTRRYMRMDGDTRNPEIPDGRAKRRAQRARRFYEGSRQSYDGTPSRHRRRVVTGDHHRDTTRGLSTLPSRNHRVAVACSKTLRASCSSAMEYGSRARPERFRRLRIGIAAQKSRHHRDRRARMPSPATRALAIEYELATTRRWE